MRCPKCAIAMVVQWTDQSKNSKTGQIYERMTYHCENEDVWVVVETPEEQ